MRDGRLVVFVTTTDMKLAERLVRGLYQVGIDVFWVELEEGLKLARAWEVDLWLYWRAAWRN